MPGASALALGPAALRLSGQSFSGSVLLVSNLNEEVYSEIVNLSCSIDLLLKKNENKLLNSCSRFIVYLVLC